MKRFSFIVLAALTLLGLSACVERQEVNPYFDPQTNTVNAQFVLNIASANTPETKQKEGDVQHDGSFRGIDDATMFAYILRDPANPSNYLDGSKVYSNTLSPAQMYNLSTVLGEGTINAASGTRVMEVSLPTGTNSIIFYAKALRKAQPGLDNDELYGAIEYVAPTSDGRTTDMTILGSKAKARLTPEMESSFEFCENLILNVINHLIRVGFNNTDGKWCSWSVTGYSLPNQTYPLKVTNNDGQIIGQTQLHWFDYAVAASSNGDNARSPLNPNQRPKQLEIILGNAYTSLTTLQYAEIRAGSGKSLERLVGDAYALLLSAAAQGYTSDEEYVAIEMMKVLKKNIEFFFNVNSDNSLSWKTPVQVQAALLSNYDITVSGSTNESLSEFPRHFHLPLGSATLGIDTRNQNPNYVQFAYNDSINLAMVYYNDTTHKGYLAIKDFTYSPELCYYCNSPIWVTKNNALTTANFPTSVTDWNNDQKWKTLGDWVKNGHVESDTRGVALINNVQYGVALLDSKVQIDALQLYDNNKNLHPEEVAKTITLGTNSYLMWTGVLIGGQPDWVGWQYLAMPQQTVTYTDGSTGIIPASKFNKMVYDKVGYVSDDKEGYQVPTTQAGAQTASNYTLVYDNYAPGASEQNTVYVALEFKNMLGTDFWGNANVVRDSGTFYIIGAINPRDEGSAWWTDNRTHNNMMPPYDDDGNTICVPRVFMQDFITKAVFHITDQSLQKAFTTVPDLRAAKLSLGLSVDLNWQEGLEYHISLGANPGGH